MGRSDRLVVEATPHSRTQQPMRVPLDAWTITAWPLTPQSSLTSPT